MRRYSYNITAVNSALYTGPKLRSSCWAETAPDVDAIHLEEKGNGEMLDTVLEFLVPCPTNHFLSLC